MAAEGIGPNALLQNHPFMALHPPLLYLGYTGLAVPFAFGVAALVTRRLDEEWLRIVRRWTLVPWIFLTLGITAGAWWSYEVLGWGGYWAWDPVENAALLPWLTATAFVHSAMVAERRGGLRIWTGALVIATFTLTLVGTFLTRSGVVASVHSFTQSAIGPWFLGGIVHRPGRCAGAARRGACPELIGGGRPSGTVSRESAFLLNNVLFLGLTFAVLFGTLLPLLVAATSGDTISVGAPWFNARHRPDLRGAPLPDGRRPGAAVGRRLVGDAAASASRCRCWRRSWSASPRSRLGLRDVRPAGHARAWLPSSPSIMLDEVVRGARARARGRGEDPATATWRLATRNRRRYGGYAVHLGVLVMAVAVAISSGLAIGPHRHAAPGESASIGAYEITPRAAGGRAAGRRPARHRDPRRGRLRRARSPAIAGAPRCATIPNSPTAIATPAVRTSLGEDLYVTLLAPTRPAGAVTLHLFVNPLVVWIWIGGAIVGIGAIFAIWPERRARRGAVEQPPAAPAAASVEGAWDAAPALAARPARRRCRSAGCCSPASAATRARSPRRSSASPRRRGRLTTLDGETAQHATTSPAGRTS